MMACTRAVARCFLIVTLTLAGFAPLRGDEADELATMMLTSSGLSSRQAAGTISFDFENIAISEILDYIATEGDLSVTLEGTIAQPVSGHFCRASAAKSASLFSAILA